MPAPTDVQQARRDQGPLTRRGETRKQNLLAAARRVFERQGFIDTNVADIVKEAKVSRGTFYTYFDTKEQVFSAVAQEVVGEMLTSMATRIPSEDFSRRVEDVIRRFIAAYEPHARMLGLIEQVGTFSPELRDLRLEARDVFVRRTRRGIERMQEAGVADPGLDVEYTAETLGAMLDQSCHLLFNLNMSFDRGRLVDTLAGIWIKALRIPVLPEGAAACHGQAADGAP